jgi:hypothetical protein
MADIDADQDILTQEMEQAGLKQHLDTANSFDAVVQALWSARAVDG